MRREFKWRILLSFICGWQCIPLNFGKQHKMTNNTDGPASSKDLHNRADQLKVCNQPWQRAFRATGALHLSQHAINGDGGKQQVEINSRVPIDPKYFWGYLNKTCRSHREKVWFLASHVPAGLKQKVQPRNPHSVVTGSIFHAAAGFVHEHERKTGKGKERIRETFQRALVERVKPLSELSSAPRSGDSAPYGRVAPRAPQWQRGTLGN